MLVGDSLRNHRKFKRIPKIRFEIFNRTKQVRFPVALSLSSILSILHIDINIHLKWIIMRIPDSLVARRRINPFNGIK